MDREKQTVLVMIKMYCRHHHGKNCNDCATLAEFAEERINKCLFQNDKPVCSECQIHCYQHEMREQIRTVMRFAGPKMIYSHPIMGIRHLIDKKRYKYVSPKEYKTSKIADK